MKSPMSSLRSPCSEYVHAHQHGNGGIRSRERNIQPFNQCIDRNHGLTEQEFGKAPHRSMFADTAFPEAFAPLVGDNSQPAQQMQRLAKLEEGRQMDRHARQEIRASPVVVMVLI